MSIFQIIAIIFFCISGVLSVVSLIRERKTWREQDKKYNKIKNEGLSNAMSLKTGGLIK